MNAFFLLLRACCVVWGGDDEVFHVPGTNPSGPPSLGSNTSKLKPGGVTSGSTWDNNVPWGQPQRASPKKGVALASAARQAVHVVRASSMRERHSTKGDPIFRDPG
ncbi:hypothetical protein B0T18DRAFT_390548 [Schizothecium vesticola]|uniref:Secreted protein n=1 Tax=Schizothecium vesticola TaxID=314040 RepID=A0AA40K4X3_9PEZI|nr:hypothetical protein B0T18DRAFT_390548 [Schizothecium vesticola]